MAWMQTLIEVDFSIPPDRIKAFITDLLKNECGFNEVEVDDAVRGKSFRRVTIDGWVFIIEGGDEGAVEIREYPDKANTTDDNSIMDFIAKYASDGYIEMISESGVLWRWVFERGRSHVIIPDIIWPKVKPREPQMGYVGGRYIPLPEGE